MPAARKYRKPYNTTQILPKEYRGVPRRRCPACDKTMYLRTNWGLSGRTFVCGEADCCCTIPA